MKIIHLFIISLYIYLFPIFTFGQNAIKDNNWIIKPFWNTSIMENESIFFIKEKSNEPPQASLLFKPIKIISVKSATGLINYTEGNDYILKPDSRILTLTESSSIPFKKREEMYPPKGTVLSIDGYRGGNNNLFFGEGHIFHDLQVVVTYTHTDKWRGYKPKFSGDKLSVTIKKLKEHVPINLVLFGDSISEGYNASAYTKVSPFMPSYGNLLALNLENIYKTKVNFINHSLAGVNTDWGIKHIEKVIKENPDLVIIAFGMNDASGKMTPEKYESNIKQMISAVQKNNSSSEFILIATMVGNPEWTHSSPELYPEYRDVLKKLCKKGIVMADITSVWTELLKYKKFADITGNGVNHPNDFGHRIYAEILLSLLTK